MSKKKSIITTTFFFFIILPSLVWAEQISLEEATARALAVDPRVTEREFYVDYARGQLQEVHAADDFALQLNSFLGLSPALKGDGVFEDDTCGGAKCNFRDDRFKLLDGVSPWAYVEAALVKPLATFGKISNYETAAKANIVVQENEVRLARSETIKQIRQAYFGYIAANNTELFLEDTRKRIDGARMRVEKWLEDGSGSAKQSDLYAVQTAIDVLTGLVAAAEGLKKVAAAGLKVLTASKEDVFPEESRISPLPLPEDDLETLKEHALKQRPEMEQVASGLEARRALVNAEKAMARPNIYTGVVGFSSYSPGRDRIDNPVITDVFNDYGATPVIGLQWSWEGGKSSAKTAQAKAELNALVAKASFARAGIPFEVAEAYHQVHAYRKMVDNLQKGVRSARRWMISTLTDFEAGLEKSDKLVSAFQGYVLANTEYLKTVYTYNMHVTQLELVVGAYK